MKCPKCSASHRYSAGMTCRCGYQFALDPKQDGYADRKIVAAFRKASSGETQFFTFNQLATEVAGMKPRGQIIGLFVFLLMGAGMALVTDNGMFFAIVFVMVTVIGLLTWLFNSNAPNLDQLRRAVAKYEREKSPCSYLLRDDRPLAEPPPEWEESDIYDYGAEGILILQRPLLVDLFVLNGFHTENRVLIVSECGYPNYIVPHVNRILEEQPDVSVSVLHDSTSKGVTMADRIEKSEIFRLGGRTVVDLGLHPEDVRGMRKLRQFSNQGAVELDHLRWIRLSTGTAAALVAGTSLAGVINTDSGASGMSFG